MNKIIIALMFLSCSVSQAGENWLGFEDKISKSNYLTAQQNYGNWCALVDNVQNPSPKSKTLKQLMKWVNKNIGYMPETSEIWKSASQTYHDMEGDCEDLSILFCSIARKKGFDVRVAIGHYRIKNKWFGHSFNIWIDSSHKKIWVIDCTNKYIVDSSKTKLYKITYSFDDKKIYRHSEVK